MSEQSHKRLAEHRVPYSKMQPFLASFRPAGHGTGPASASTSASRATATPHRRSSSTGFGSGRRSWWRGLFIL